MVALPLWISFFFFFQAEDGIRDGTVTGVQTCALPIYLGGPLNGDGRPAGAGRRAPHRLYDADGRRVPALDDPDEPEEMVHGKLHRSQIGRASCRERV